MIHFLNYLAKSKEIELSAVRFSRDLPNFVKPLLVKFLFL